MQSRSLEILFNQQQSRMFPIEKPIVRIGRAQDNDIVLAGDGRDVSRWHAVISSEADGSMMLADLESVNGTFLNGHPIAYPVPVGPDDTIKIGDFRLVVREGCTQGPRREKEPIGITADS
jgi:pSer/pThr/pTyr-binding forkhead associated (FHA) protein